MCVAVIQTRLHKFSFFFVDNIFDHVDIVSLVRNDYKYGFIVSISIFIYTLNAYIFLNSV